MYRNILIALSLICLVAACRRTKVELSTTSSPTLSASTEPAYKAQPKPTEAELRQVIARNYKDAVTIDSSQTVPFLTGDFNGDNSEDVAVVVKPGKGKLPELNSEYANWTLEDPHERRPQKQNRRPPSISVQDNDVLLAVIHGHESEGWRNALATQTYLLKNAVGKEFEIQLARQITSGEDRSLPRMKGDVIRERLDGTAGIIYWTGARYAWHPVVE